MTSYVDDNPFPKVIVVEGATPATPASGKQTLFIDSSDHVLKRINSSATVTSVEAAGSGALTRITETIVGAGGVASVTFSSIPGSYRHLKVMVVGRGDTAAANTPVHAQFNTDTAGHYDEQEHYDSGATTLVTDGAQAQSSGYFGYIAAASDAAGLPGAMEATIYDYARTAWQKVWRSQSTLYVSTAAGGVLVLDLGGGWRSTAAITTITLLPGAGNFAENTVCSLYGLS